MGRSGREQTRSLFRTSLGVISLRTLNLADGRMHLAPQAGLCKHNPSFPRCQHPRINVSLQEGSVPGFCVTFGPQCMQGGTPLKKLARIQGGLGAPACAAAQVPSAGKEMVFSGFLWRLARALSLGVGEASLAQNQPGGPLWLGEGSLLACSCLWGALWSTALPGTCPGAP